MSPRRALLCIVLAALDLVGAHGVAAHAQSTRYPPEPADFDRDMEEQSRLWERVARPNLSAYELRIKHVKDLVNESRRRSRTGRDRDAEEILQHAVTLAPDEPVGYWLLGLLAERREAWAECAGWYGKVFALDAGYEPAGVPLPDNRKPGWALLFGLAECRLHSGEVEQAIELFQRVLSRGIRDRDAIPVYRRLGEGYMALGRLREAIEVLEIAYRGLPGDRHTAYLLAVAYDRDEQEARARSLLAETLRRDPSMARLERPEGGFVPDGDEYYYLGLSHAVKGEVERAVFYFRQYLHVTGQGPWRRRVMDHLADLSRAPVPGHVAIHSRALTSMTFAEATRAIAAVRDELDQCVAPVPGVLFDVRVTVMGQAQGALGRRRRSKSARKDARFGVKAVVAQSFVGTAAEVAAAQECIESAAASMPFGALSDAPDQYVSLSFPLIAMGEVNLETSRTPARAAPDVPDL